MGDLTHTIKPSGGDFSSLSAAVDHMESEHPDFTGTGFDGIGHLEIDGDWSGVDDTTQVLIHNLTTDASHYLNIYTTAAARHTGKWDETKYRLVFVPSAANQRMLLVSYEEVRVAGVQVSLNDSGSKGDCVCFNAYEWAGQLKGYFLGCIADRLDSNNVVGSGFVNGGLGDGSVYFGNCVASNFKNATNWSSGFVSDASASQATYCYNCTAYNCSKGFYQVNSNTFLKNCLAIGCVDGFYQAAHANSTDNASDIDGDAPGTDPHDPVSVDFVDSAARDFHLLSSDEVVDLGADLSSDTDWVGCPTDDIDGDSRSGDWDIGADEYVLVAGGGGSSAFLM